MQTKKATPWSFDRASDFTIFLTASAVGVGNFLTLPELVLYQGGLKVLLLHLAGLALLGVPLVLAEIILGRWLLRPLNEGARALDRRFIIVPTVAFFATAFIATAYAFELGRLVVYSLRYLNLLGWGLPGLRFENLADRGFQLTAALLVLGLGGALVVRRPSRLVPWLRYGVLFSLGSWAVLSAWVSLEWGGEGFGRLLYWDTATISSDLILKVSSFSLFTLSAGLGIVYNLTFYGSQRPRQTVVEGLGFWARAGRPLRVLGWVLLADIVSSLASLALISPFGVGGLESSPLPGDQLLLDWLPQIFGPRFLGEAAGSLLLVSLLSAGFVAFVTLLDFAVTNLQIEQKWSRRKAMIHVLGIGAILLIPELFPRLRQWIEAWGQNVLLPLSALGFALLAGWRMPARAQRNIFGRGLLLDPFFLLWRLSIRFVVPAVLVLLILRGFSTL